MDLSDEDRNALAEQGIGPDSLDYEGTEIEAMTDASAFHLLHEDAEAVLPLHLC